MPYASIDDQMTFNAKIVRAGNEAVGAWVRMIALANAQLTDGLVELAQALAIAPKKLLDKMVDVRLLEREGEDFRVHDFHKFNPRAEDVRARRDAEKRRKADYRAGQKRGTGGRMEAGHQAARPASVPREVPPDVPPPVPAGHRTDVHRSSSLSSSLSSGVSDSSNPRPQGTLGAVSARQAEIERVFEACPALAADARKHAMALLSLEISCSRPADVTLLDVAREACSSVTIALASGEGVKDPGRYLQTICRKLLVPGALAAARAERAPRTPKTKAEVGDDDAYQREALELARRAK